MLTKPLRVTLAALFGAALLAIGAPLIAHAQADHHSAGDKSATSVTPGDNGTVKIHRSTTPGDDRRNQPHVCEFYLVGFGFDPAQAVSWKIRSWPPTGDRSLVKDGALVMDENGWGRTDDMTLENGHYKLFWNFVGEHGKAKHKVFWVNCPKASESPSPTTSTPSSPPSSSTPSPTNSAPAPSAGAPTPVQTNLPVTG